ncbi:MAG: 3-hydroxyacyl-CoA dehydrogenase NAD-binding domain-containing protein [Pirellulales bacterium]|nr:3-hydroxyacyl-CoA dehydrogenase NAD-binding domain-containing protein [Thermoguttaceae bacterium]MDD4788782.1 3-hydroxyacyl-CoA dehydrogenase NAD-binding domain-containing protein [Pirellulales bacterium]MDI9443070.1 3-hydroxyacyl-CoA dehydrogenase NAD-binding domain-containing protein [Planctomycetota bacterium]NLZ00350.1 hypothetical protein [Pirellulaceae bacterium]
MGISAAFQLDRARGDNAVRHIERLLAANRQRLATAEAIGVQGSIAAIGIVGAGTMGLAVAATAIRHGIDVVLTDAVEAAWTRAAEKLAEIAETHPGGGKPLGKATATGRIESLAACDVVLESIVEDADAKRALLRDIDRRLPRETLLATGTSTIPVGRLAQGLAHPERVCGVHFFLPVAERPVVEVIAGPATPAAACKKAVGLAAALGKEAISAPDVVGFLVNRLMLPYVSEAMQLLAEGVAEETIERAALDFGMPQGPLSLLDEIGLDTALDCGWVFAGAYEDRIAISPLLVALVKARRLGLKTRAGFFRYTRRDDGSFAQEIDPAVAALLERWKTPRGGSASADAVAARLFLPMLFEGVRLLEEHAGCLPGDIDLGAVLALGMSPRRGGPLFWADQVGIPELLRLAGPLAGIGKRMQPPDRLRRMAQDKRSFYK